MKTANKGIPKVPLFGSFSQKMSCPLFGVPTVINKIETIQNKIDIKINEIYKNVEKVTVKPFGGMVSIKVGG